MKKLFLAVALVVPALALAQTPRGSISGQILARDGQPAVAVRVSAMAVPETGVPINSGTALVSLAMTDNEGRYRLENVPAGRYYIMAGFVDLPSYYPGVAATSDATAVNVLSGTPVTGINFAVANPVGVTVSGRVRRVTGTGGVGGQRVALMGGTPSIQEVTTAADGSFQIPRVRPGTYRLTSTAGRPYEQPLSVTVADKDVTGLELLVVPVVEVTGTVAIEGTYPPPRIQLQLSPFKGTGQNAGISGMAPDGSFRASLPEGDYRVSWTNLPLGYEIKSLTAGSLDLISVPLKVSTDAPPPAIRVLLSVSGNPWVKVSGRVVNLGSMRTLSLSGPNSNPIELAIKPDGTFEIPQALPGTYQVRPSATAITTSLGASPMSVVIPNQDTTNLVITLPLTKDVPGIVVNSTGSGVEGRFQLNYSARGPNSSSSGGRSVTTQADGKFTIQISEGMDIQLSVAAPGYNIKSLTYGTADLLRGTVRITSSDTAEIRVVLDTTSTTISGGVGVGVGGGGAAVSGGVLGAIFTSSSSAVAPPPPAVPTAPPASSGNRINEAIAKSNLVSSVPPVYPALATAARVQGSVVLQIEISIDGKVQNASVVSGIPMLNDAAIQAVRQWTYKPFVLNGQTIPVSTTVTVDFALR